MPGVGVQPGTQGKPGAAQMRANHEFNLKFAFGNEAIAQLLDKSDALINAHEQEVRDLAKLAGPDGLVATGLVDLGSDLLTVDGKVDAVKADTTAILASGGSDSFGPWIAGESKHDFQTDIEIGARDATVSALASVLYGANNTASLGLQRLRNAPSFLQYIEGWGRINIFSSAGVLINAHEGARLAGETTLAMLNRLYPAYAWEDNHNGSGLVGATLAVDSGGWARDVFYSPPAPSLDEIKRLWDYTPSSGPPTRNGIDDFMGIVSLLPVQF